jgi:hypothetical protein
MFTVLVFWLECIAHLVLCLIEIALRLLVPLRACARARFWFDAPRRYP